MIDLCDQCIQRAVRAIRQEYSQPSIIFVLASHYRPHSVPLVTAALSQMVSVHGFGEVAKHAERVGADSDAPPKTGASKSILT
jgi:hypothetical protein